MRVLVIHGPNLNLLGEREPNIYGSQTLAQLDHAIGEAAERLGLEVRIVQHNGEGAIVEEIHAARKTFGAIVINPGAYAHYSHAIADALAAARVPAIEVHLTNVYAREEFRRKSVVAPVCVGTICGFGAKSYLLALDAAAAQASPMGQKPL